MSMIRRANLTSVERTILKSMKSGVIYTGEELGVEEKALNILVSKKYVVRTGFYSDDNISADFYRRGE